MDAWIENNLLEKLNYSWHFFFFGNLCIVCFFLLCDSLWHIMEDSLQQVPITFSLLQRIVSVMHCGPQSPHSCPHCHFSHEWREWLDHLSSLLLSHSASTPEHRSALSGSLNGLRIDLLYIASFQRKLNAVYDWSCVEMQWNIFSYLVLSFAHVLGW